jgi:hypothetical protein
VRSAARTSGAATAPGRDPSKSSGVGGTAQRICPLLRTPTAGRVRYGASGASTAISFNCNQGLGNFRDDPRGLIGAVDYLTRGNSWSGKELDGFQVTHYRLALAA